MIKALIFDYNGVLTTRGTFHQLIQEYAAQQKKDPLHLKEILETNWRLARIGQVDSQQVWNSIAQYLEYDSQQLRSEMIARFPLRQELLQHISLWKNMYKTALLTNEIKDWMEESIAQHNLHQYFDAIVTSYEEGLAKPDPRIFTRVLERLNITAQESVYIDDQEKNTSAAEKLGMKTILFSSFPQMLLELERVGVQRVSSDTKL